VAPHTPGTRGSSYVLGRHTPRSWGPAPIYPPGAAERHTSVASDMFPGLQLIQVTRLGGGQLPGFPDLPQGGRSDLPARAGPGAGITSPANSLDTTRPAGHGQHMGIRIQCLCIDTTDPARTAAFWQSALGWRRTLEKEDQVVLEPPEGSPEDGVVPDLVFLKVPEGKAVKNRLHLDLRPGDQAAEVARLEELGARRISIGQGEVSWVVMADPDGNEFDVLRPLTPDELIGG